MDVKQINPILAAFTEVLPQIGFNSIQRNNVSVIGSNLEYNGILINIGLFGSIKGAIIIGMSFDSAKSFASKMMMGMEVTSIDSLAQSAIAEMGNMVCANACIKFSEAGISGLNISPPTVIMSDFGTAVLPVPKVIVLSFTVDDIDVDVYVGLI